jgi:hypothetical protein
VQALRKKQNLTQRREGAKDRKEKIFTKFLCEFFASLRLCGIAFWF